MWHAGFAPKAPAVPLHFLLKRYATANNPAIANIASNPGVSSSGVGSTTSSKFQYAQDHLVEL
jgi:hypothetical protein